MTNPTTDDICTHPACKICGCLGDMIDLSDSAPQECTALGCTASATHTSRRFGPETGYCWHHAWWSDGGPYQDDRLQPLQLQQA